MRLTLRTLLAYLDDVLEPSEAKEIGRKLQDSPVARALVSRLKEVMRRRRIGAPDLTGPGAGIDPNLVAQYLDNTLPPELVSEVEKVCLESDQQLAEVAAAHQILTLALGEPVEIAPSTRERLYVLGPVDAADRLEAGSDGVHRGNGLDAAVPAVARTLPGSAGPSFEQSLPEYLRPKPWSGKWVLIGVGGLLLLALWIGAIVNDPNMQQSVSKLRPTPQRETTKDEPAMLVTDTTPAVEKSIPALPPTKPVPLAVVPLTDDTPVDALSVVAVAVIDKPALPEPPQPMPPQTEPVSVKPKLPAVTATYISQEGVLLLQNPSDKSWYVVPQQSILKSGSRVACPEPFEAVLEFSRGGLRLNVLGGTVIELGPATEQSPITIRLIKGRLIFTAATRDESLLVNFVMGHRAGLLQLDEGDTQFGVELLPQEPVGFEQPVPPASQLEGVYVLNGNVQWTVAELEPRAAVAGIYLSLLTDQPPVGFGTAGNALPDWLEPQRRKTESLLRRFAKQYEKEFELNQPIDSDMRALIRDPRPRISELAVRCLTMIDNYNAVSQAMAQAEHEDVRKAAMTGLRQWLGVSVERGELLKQSLATYYEHEDHVIALYRLLWGISVEEASQELASYGILEWLRSDKVEIRELTLANLMRLTGGRRYDYRPLASPGQREPAIKRWFDHVGKEGGIVKAGSP